MVSNTIADKLAIQELMARYCFAIDFGDIEGWVSCFTKDGIFETPFGTFKGLSALRGYISERKAERREKGFQLRHIVTNSIINVQKDRASSKCYLLLLMVSPEGVKLLSTGVYNDESRRIRGKWYFSHRKIEFDHSQWLNQVFPPAFLGKCESEGRIKKTE